LYGETGWLTLVVAARATLKTCIFSVFLGGAPDKTLLLFFAILRPGRDLTNVVAALTPKKLTFVRIRARRPCQRLLFFRVLPTARPFTNVIFQRAVITFLAGIVAAFICTSVGTEDP
jgi:hypothetical protein